MVLAILLLPTLSILVHKISQHKPLEALFYASLPLLLWIGAFFRETGAATAVTLMTILAMVISFWVPGEPMPIWSAGAHIVSFGLMALIGAGARNLLEEAASGRVRQKEPEQWAFQDSLTELANRHHLLHSLHDALQERHHDGAPFAVLMIDLDEFKPVNDQYGPDIGDEVLRIVAARIRTHRRPQDLVARLGGDEFVVLLNNCRHIEQAKAIAERILSEFADPLLVQSASYGPIRIKMGASIGLAHVQHGASDVEQLLKQADTALYRAKRAGKCRVEAYHP